MLTNNLTILTVGGGSSSLKNESSRMPNKMDRSMTKYLKCCDASTIDIVSNASVLDDSRIRDDSSINVETDSAPQEDGKKSTCWLFISTGKKQSKKLFE